jgi:hypothetical protein
MQAIEFMNGYGRMERLRTYVSKNYVGTARQICNMFNFKTANAFNDYMKRIGLLKQTPNTREPTDFAVKYGLIRTSPTSYGTPIYTDFGLAVLFYTMPKYLVNELYIKRILII